MCYVVAPLAIPFKLATPMGVQLLDELVADIVRGKGHFPTEQELAGVGIDADTVVLNYMAAIRTHDEMGERSFDPGQEEKRIWSRLPTAGWTAPRLN